MIKYLLLILQIFFLLGCSSKIPNYSDVILPKDLNISDAKEKLLVKRFSEYWHLRSNGALEDSYKYELPHQRYLNTLEEYKRMTRGYRGVKTKLVKIDYIDENQSIITRKVIQSNKEMIRKDKWFYILDNWYHKFYQTIFPPSNQEEAQFQ
jgi:hypothetical protein